MTRDEAAAIAAHRAIEHAYREDWTSILATLAGQVGGDLGLAEDAVAEAFAAAASEWPDHGVPTRPGAWLTTVARRRAIDHLRREQTRATNQKALEHLEQIMRDDPDPTSDAGMTDDRLRLIFTCCHPALGLEARVALTLRTVGGFDIAEVARAFLTSETTMYQRVVRAKRKVKAAGIPYRVPSTADLPERLDGVLRVLYLIYNEGHVATGGDELVRADVCEEAIRLLRMVVELLPDEAEPLGLLSLLLLTDARRAARTDEAGRPVALDDQDRARWNRDAISEGTELLARGLALGPPSPHLVQAAIAALHAEAPAWEMTDWPQIAALYAELERLDPSPVITINRAAAVAQADGPHVGLALLATLDGDERLARYQPFHAARAELLARAGDRTEAAAAYRRALDLTDNAAERAALERRSRRLLGAPEH